MNSLTQFAMRLMFGFLLSLTATTLYSQTEEYSLEDPKWKEYIMDGVNSNYVWARQIAPTKLAIGLLEGEGYLSLENDTCIWFRDRSYTDDQLIAIRNVDQYNGQLFVL